MRKSDLKRWRTSDDTLIVAVSRGAEGATAAVAMLTRSPRYRYSPRSLLPHSSATLKKQREHQRRRRLPGSGGTTTREAAARARAHTHKHVRARARGGWACTPVSDRLRLRVLIGREAAATRQRPSGKRLCLHPLAPTPGRWHRLAEIRLRANRGLRQPE